MLPLRVMVALVLFAPVALLLGLLSSVGEWLNDMAEYFFRRLDQLSNEWLFLTNSGQYQTALENARRIKQLEELVRLYRAESDQPETDSTPSH